MTILLPSLAVLIPILTLPFWLFYFDITPKIAVLLLGAAVACALLPWRFQTLRDFAKTPAGRRIAWLLGLQGIALAISTAASTNPWLSIGGGNWRMYGLVTQLALLLFMLLAAAAIAQGEVTLQPVLRAIAASGSLIAAYAILQYFGWDPLLPPVTYHIGEGVWTIVRPPGTIGHADYLGSYLVFVVFLGGSLAWTETARWQRALGLFAIASGSIAIVLSGTRSAMLGLAAGGLLLAIRFRPNLKLAAAGAVCCALLLGGFYVSPWGLRLRARTRWSSEDPRGGARLLLWRDSLQMAANRPLAGWGAETYSAEFTRFQSLDLARAYPDFYHESPHNILLDELIAKGFAGALPFFAWCAMAAFAAWRALRRSGGAAAAMLAGLVSLQFNAFVLTTAFFFFLTSVILLASSPTTIEPREPTRRAAWATAAIAWPAGLFLTIFAVRLLIADFLLAATRTQFESGNVIAAAATHDAVRRWDPRAGSSDLYYSRNMAALVRRQKDLLTSVKAWQEAVQSGIRAAHGDEERQNAWYHLASLYAQVNNPKDAEKSLRGAIAASPNWFKPHWMLAQVLRATGKRDEALAEAAAAVERDGGKHREVSDTLRQLQK